jgi:hypothetical protein
LLITRGKSKLIKVNNKLSFQMKKLIYLYVKYNPNSLFIKCEKNDKSKK